ncbi:MAG: MFS transporter, partial [Acidobacteria bacterium]
AIGGFLTLMLLDVFRYVPNQVQTPDSINGIKLLFSVIPGIFALICGLVLIFYPINEPMLRKIEADLKERKSQEREGVLAT